MVEWNELFVRYGGRIHLEKTGVLCVGQQNRDLYIRLEGKKPNQRDSFVYLGGAVCGDGGAETELRKLEWKVGGR